MANANGGFNVADAGPSLSKREELEQQLAALDARREGVDLSPTSSQRLGPFTVGALILNRTIGTGIFAQPSNVLALTGSAGLALVLWGAGGIIIMCLLLCWLELGMTVPLFNHVDEDGNHHVVSTPRSGGDKNFLEFIYRRPKLLATCVFGVVFIVFGHLAANAIQFGIFMATVTHPQCREGEPCFSKGAVIGWALGVVTVCSLINISTRRLAISLNNWFAVAKVLFVAILALMGIIYGSIHGDGCRQISWENKGEGGSFGDVVLALVFAAYPYSGFEQPFYVLAEVRDPRRTFPKATICALSIALVLFPLANFGYLCMTPYTGNATLPENMVVAMFERLSGNGSNDTKENSVIRGVNAILALSAFANIMAQTFTGARVKQEIAKEGILPYSLLFATGSDSLISKMTRRRDAGPAAYDIDKHAEQVPIAATGLHLGFEVLLILAVGIPLSPTDAYRLLSAIKVFSVVGILGLLTVAGLLYLKIDSLFPRAGGRGWSAIVKFLPWLSPLPVLIATAGLALIVFGPFVPPTVSQGGTIPYFAGLVTAWAITFASVGWWLWLKFDLRRDRQYLHVERRPFIEPDGENGELVLKAEFVVVERLPLPATNHV
ncbi:amino acid permease-domain-containing protein [Plectosphaerella plurivora]|uniref:Amino acid permease-domain-containing protein n=1 Tax=Plectosphaerella plurivora TaxID=936078 RepID=A0A9P8VKL7_9PEZI|nr:amino acid permease-domain-containing protein [Plectosphaerella plurivora]